MKNQLSLSVKTPCTENFNDFSPTQLGGYCGSCKKEVIDFSVMNSQEILHYFKTNTSKNTCGRFRNDQLTSYSTTLHRKKKLSFFSGLAFIFITLFSFTKTHAQNLKNQAKVADTNPPKFQEVSLKNNITVKGIVLENNIPLPGANIVLESTVMGTTTDFDGKFEFPTKLKKGDVLIVSYLGFSSKKVTIQDQNSASEVVLEVNLQADACILMGQVAVKKVYSSKKD